jgi:RsiW-degrading membrane proteinase PrsW (M82 family)
VQIPRPLPQEAPAPASRAVAGRPPGAKPESLPLHTPQVAKSAPAGPRAIPTATPNVSAGLPGAQRNLQTNEVPKKPTPRPTATDAAATISAKGRRRFLYWLFALTLIPLAFSFLDPRDDTEERFARTIASHPEVAARFDSQHPPTKESLLSRLPDGKIDGAHLAYNSWMHWFYALLSAAGFLGVTWLIFSHGNARPKHVLWVGVSTATFGIVFLLGVQWIAEATQGYYVTGGSIVTLLFYIVKFIGFSYRAALDPDTGFLLSFMGFTFGVGLCEELTKALPLVFYIRGGSKLDSRGTCLWGLASGIGFGVAEGVMYSSQFYNGLATNGIYFVRFISCVGLHAVWGGAVGIMAWRRREWLQSDGEWTDLAVSLLYILAVPMVLHGLYDTLLKKDMQGYAFLAALASFAWLIAVTEWTPATSTPRHRAAIA